MSLTFWVAIVFFAVGGLLLILWAVLQSGVYVVGFHDSPQGRASYVIWNNLTEKQREALVPAGRFKYGVTVHLFPGMTFKKIGGITLGKHFKVKRHF